MDLFSSLSHSFSTFALDHLNFRPGEREKLAAYFLKALCPPLKRALPIKISDRDASESRRSFCSANFAPAENGKKKKREKRNTQKKRERKKERTGTSSRLDERGRRRRILLLSADGKNRARAYGNSLFTRTRSPSAGSIIGEEHKSDEKRSEKAERQGERTAGKKNDEKAFETTIPAS